jgi:hypothetical protein
VSTPSADVAASSRGTAARQAAPDPQEVAMGLIDAKLDKDYEEKPIADLADAPVSALQGVSDEDAKHLKEAFNITTVRDLGTNKYFLWAQAIARLAD